VHVGELDTQEPPIQEMDHRIRHKIRAVELAPDVNVVHNMSDVVSYRDLDAWNVSMNLVENVYRATAAFLKSELYGLTSQTRRAAASIPSNVAEGNCRPTTGAYAHHVGIALGSHGELETCLEIAARLAFLTQSEKKRLVATTDRVGQMLNRLHQSLERKIEKEREQEAQQKPSRY
jgi:four helix bundle protein